MGRAGWCGATLVVGAVACLVASEIVGTAYASRQEEKRYTFAVSSGSRLVLQSRGGMPADITGAHPESRTLDCRRVLLMGDVRLGYVCRGG